MRLILISFSLMWLTSCSRKAISWDQIKSEDCSALIYGRVDAKRLLTQEDISLLQKQGLRILEFVLENQYLGCWNQKWVEKSLDKTPLNALTPFESKEKIGSGMQLDQLRNLDNTVGHAMVLIQTLAPVDSLELIQYGKILFSRDHFYRMVVPNNHLMDLLDYPCLRLMSIVKENYEPDRK